MISVAAPLWLLGLAVGPLLWWLHRARGHGRSVAVASILLFRDVPAPRSGGPRAPVTDPAWRRRVASVVVLTLALAGLTLHGPARELIVWVDDGPSMATRESGGTRLAAGFAALRRALPHDPTTHIELRSLAEPGLRYEANQLAPLVRSREARVPASGAISTQAAQWLLTDGANAALEDWARGGAIEQVIRVGTETENVGVIGLAVRARLSDSARLDGTVALFNAGRRPARRDLVLHLGPEPVLRQSLELSPGQTLVLGFTLSRPKQDSAGLEAQLSPNDALPEDDHLELDARALQRRRIRIGGGCPEAVRSAVAVEADLELAASAGTADIAITCAADDGHLSEAAAQSLPTLVVAGRSDARDAVTDAAWSAAASAALSETLLPRMLVLRGAGSNPPPDAEPLLRSGAGTLAWRPADARRRVETRIDLGSPALAAAPEYPLLVGELLELAIGEPLIARVAASDRDPRTITIAPTAATSLGASSAADGVLPAAPRARRGTPLAPPLVAIAAVLILWDLGVSVRSTTRLARAERGA